MEGAGRGGRAKPFKAAGPVEAEGFGNERPPDGAEGSCKELPGANELYADIVDLQRVLG